ncbi:MAG: isoleucine--tRNA ligase [Candidatus Thorarchaeota archaeon]|jgi:isoleucyl-tRNA synthetase
MSFKDTLNLPNTTFPMKGKLSEKEPEKYDAWSESVTWSKMKENRHESETFVLHDGPPYANGSIHIGHAMNKILKDFVTKYHYFRGDQVEFAPGWDCHGLPIEREVKKILKKGIDKRMSNFGYKGFSLQGMAPQVLRSACREYAQHHVDLQMKEFQSLGVIADWENPYLTMDYSYEASIYKNFCNLFKEGLITERHKPVYWSTGEKTALAEAEVEYQDESCESIYVIFDFEIQHSELSGVLVWTTTPWTLPANVAVAANPDATYAVVHIKDMSKYVLVAKDCLDKIDWKYFGKTDWKYREVEILDKEIKGSELEGLQINSPLKSDKRPIILDKDVETDTGTGFVHLAPGHGEWDYQIGQRENLPSVMPVDENGHYTEEILDLIDERGYNNKEYVGVSVIDANEKIIVDLEIHGSLVCTNKIDHRYPYCWRSKTPIIFRSTKQWFLDLSKLRDKALSELENVDFHPERDKTRLEKMVRERPEWCLSRQREWGVPIALFRHVETGEILCNEEVFDHITTLFETYGCDCWWTSPNSYFFPPHLVSEADNYEKVMDILDVWFDSGLSWDNLNWDDIKSEEGKSHVYFEGNDQHRGWFQSSLWTSMALQNKAPYHKVITHGFVVDKNGKKMSKSQGNVISPLDIVNKQGAEVLRTWVALTDYTKEVTVSDEILKHAAGIYQKIRNTFRYMIANLGDKEPKPKTHLNTDLWIVEKCFEVAKKAEEHFDNYDFQKGMHLVTEFMINDLSGIYMFAAKDRLYCGRLKSDRRLSAQQALYSVLLRLRKTLAPILTYTMDEVNEHAPKWRSFEESILDTNLYSSKGGTWSSNYPDSPIYLSGDKEEYWKEARNEFNTAFDSIKKQGLAKDTLEVVISENGMTKEFGECEDWFGVSRIATLSKDLMIGAFTVGEQEFYIYLSDKEKCDRCWKRNASKKVTLNSSDKVSGDYRICVGCELAVDEKNKLALNKA